MKTVAVAVAGLLCCAASGGQIPAPDQAACFTNEGASTYDVMGDVKVEGGTLWFKSQPGLNIRLSGPCLLRRGGTPYELGSPGTYAVQCYPPSTNEPFYSAVTYPPFASDGILGWVEVDTGDILYATTALRCDVYHQTEEGGKP